MIEPDELESLKAKISILEEENLALSQSSEELLLINTLFDTIKENQSLVSLYQSVLEKVAILKDIPFCSFLRKNSDSLTLLASYALFKSDVKEGTQLKLEVSDLKKIIYEPLSIVKENISAVKQQLFLSDTSCVCTEILLVPFNSLLTGECVFLLVDDDLSGDRLSKMLSYLSYVIDRIVERFDIIYYQDVLQKLNHELEEKVLERTNELLGLNEQYKSEIEERKKSEELLSISEKRFKMLFEESTDAIFLVDKTNGKYLDANKAAEKLTGRTVDELKTLDVFTVTPDGAHQRLNKLSKDNAQYAGEVTYVRPDGSNRIAIVSVVHINSRMAFGIAHDITESKLAEDKLEKQNIELIEAKEKAEEMVRLKSYFFANMSHELRTPFVGILGFAEILKDVLENREEREYAEQILKSSKRLTDTLNKILNLSRIEFDKVEVKNTQVDVCELLKSIESFYSNSAKINNTTITSSVEEDNLTIYSDAKLLEDILNNLVSNAIKFTENGSISLSAKRIIDKDNARLLITVKDTGIGIPEEKQSLVWQEFRQASEGYNRSFEGTGLGLTITKRYVELLNGTIALISEEHKGTSFIISLPMTSTNAEILTEGKEIALIKKSKEKIKSNVKPKLLYVEDDAVALEFISIILRSGYDVDTAINAATALEYTAKKEYDILMLDINLGRGMDGVELMQRIREIDYYKNVPMVAVTAYAAELDKAEFLSKGFTHYISKPFTQKELNKLLAEIVNQK